MHGPVSLTFNAGDHRKLMIRRCKRMKEFEIALPIAFAGELFKIFPVLSQTVENITIHFLFRDEGGGPDLEYIKPSAWALVDNIADKLPNLEMLTLAQVFATEHLLIHRHLPKLSKRGVLQFVAPPSDPETPAVIFIKPLRLR